MRSSSFIRKRLRVQIPPLHPIMRKQYQCGCAVIGLVTRHRGANGSNSLPERVEVPRSLLCPDGGTEDTAVLEAAAKACRSESCSGHHFILWRHRLIVRMAGFHPVDAGANPVAASIYGPIFYRSGKLVLNQKSGVRFPVGLPLARSLQQEHGDDATLTWLKAKASLFPPPAFSLA